MTTSETDFVDYNTRPIPADEWCIYYLLAAAACMGIVVLCLRMLSNLLIYEKYEPTSTRNIPGEVVWRRNANPGWRTEYAYQRQHPLLYLLICAQSLHICFKPHTKDFRFGKMHIQGEHPVLLWLHQKSGRLGDIVSYQLPAEFVAYVRVPRWIANID